MKTQTEIIIGTGVLSWPREERVSDRYGLVNIRPDGETSLTDSDDLFPLNGNAPSEGTQGTLAVDILQTRKSTHIGDLFHGVYPRETPAGTRLVLGSGTVIRSEVGRSDCIGVKPAKKRNQWLNMRALYDCHEHLVNLIFIPA